MKSFNDAKIDLSKKVCRVLRSAGKECYVVGGAVRDLIIGNSIHDIDITTNAKPSDVIDIFSKAGMKVIPTGIKFGTVTAIVGDNPVEITTYRADGKYTDFRHPDTVTYASSIEADLSRRDFTVNAMAYDPIDDTLKDPHDGQGDIKRKVIRAVGSPAERFDEDLPEIQI